MKRQNGITLIALVISIIVMLILAGVSINAIVGDNGILKNAQKANLSQKFATYKEELELQLAGEISCANSSLKKYIPSMEEQDLRKFVISKGKLSYIGNNEDEKKVAESLSIGTEMAGCSNVDDIMNIFDKVLSFSETQDIPQKDNEANNTTLARRKII